MSHEHVYKISSRYLQKWLRYDIKHVKNRHFSRHFGTLPWFFEFCFLTDFDASKSVLGSFFAFLEKIWPKSDLKSDLKTCIAALNHDFFLFDLFHLVTWDDLDLYYGHKAQEMILTDVSDTIHADSLALFALNIDILLADVTKPEKSKILTLTWSVTSSVTSGSNFLPCPGSSRTGLSNGVWNLEIGPVVWEISGGPLPPPPPAGRVANQTPAGRGITFVFFLVQKKIRIRIICNIKYVSAIWTWYTRFEDSIPLLFTVYWFIFIALCILSRARPGGGYPPPRFFADSEKKRRRVAAPNLP